MCQSGCHYENCWGDCSTGLKYCLCEADDLLESGEITEEELEREEEKRER